MMVIMMIMMIMLIVVDMMIAMIDGDNVEYDDDDNVDNSNGDLYFHLHLQSVVGYMSP